MKEFFVLMIFAAVITGCKGKEAAKAKIFERTEMKEDKLMIRYTYSFNDKAYNSSATIQNRIINNDSINIIVDPANPEKSVPEFEK